MSFSYSGYVLADVEAEYVNAQPMLGSHGLNIGLALHKKSLEPGVGPVFVNAFQLRVRVEGLNGRGPELLGATSAQPHVGLTVNDLGLKDIVPFEWALSGEQLAAIEQLRGGGGLRFHLGLSALAYGKKGPWPVFEDLRYDVNVSHWLELLQRMGAAEYLTIPLKLPVVAAGHPLAPAMAKLRSAYGFLQRGEYDAAVATSRSSLEALQAVAGRPRSEVLGFYQSKHRKMSRAERHELLQLSVYHMANLAAHHSSEDPEVFSRSDASLIVGSVAALLDTALAKRSSEGDGAAVG